jgi:hypothetical protein
VRECNGKRDCVVANLFNVFDAKQDLSAGDDDHAENGVASTPKSLTGRCSSGAML